MEAISNLALVELLQYIISGQFGMLDNWLLANWYGVITTAIGFGFFAKYLTAKTIAKNLTDVVYRWRTAKADGKYTIEELNAIGSDFVKFADDLEKKVKRGFFTNRSR